MPGIVLHDLGPSPNNMKVRIALAYKGIPYERVDVDPADHERRGIIEISGQPLTPVLTHGDTVIYDSGAILRYLEANFPDTPRLHSTDRQTMYELDRFERWARGPLAQPVGIVFPQAMSENPDLDACVRASELMHELTGELESRLESSDWLFGDGMTIADVTAAPMVFYGMVPEAIADTHPAIRFFADNLKLGEGRERTREWCGRVMGYAR